MRCKQSKTFMLRSVVYAVWDVNRVRRLCRVLVAAVTECLEYPDFSGIVLYRFVVLLTGD